MNTITKVVYSIVAFIVGWAAGRILDDFTDTLIDQNGCRRKYTIEPIEDTCIQCQACRIAVDDFIERTGAGPDSMGSMSNEEMINLLDNIDDICPVDVVRMEVECTVG